MLDFSSVVLGVNVPGILGCPADNKICFRVLADSNLTMTSISGDSGHKTSDSVISSYSRLYPDFPDFVG